MAIQKTKQCTRAKALSPSSSPYGIRRLRSGNYSTSSPCKAKKRRIKRSTLQNSENLQSPLELYNQTFVLPLEGDWNAQLELPYLLSSGESSENDYTLNGADSVYSLLNNYQEANFDEAILQLISFFHIKLISVDQELDELTRVRKLNEVSEESTNHPVKSSIIAGS